MSEVLSLALLHCYSLIPSPFLLKPKWLLKRPGRCLNITDLGGLQPRHTFLFKYKLGGGDTRLQLLLELLLVSAVSAACVTFFFFLEPLSLTTTLSPSLKGAPGENSPPPSPTRSVLQSGTWLTAVNGVTLASKTCGVALKMEISALIISLPLEI